jgi:hypothetical protein
MRTQRLLALALFAAALLCSAARAQYVPSADKAIEKAVKDLKFVRDRTPHPADKDKLSEAIAPLEQVAAKKKPGKDDNKTKRYTRAAFKALVVGKSKDQVKQILGKPARTTELNSAEYSVIWHYKNLTRDPDAEQGDPDANILFDDRGVAVSVDFVRFPF